MIEQWFNKEIETILQRGHRAVVCDTTGEGAFLLQHLPGTVTVLTASTKWQEIEVRYEAEKSYENKAVVFYTTTAPHELKFLQEYATTYGVVDLSDLEKYIKDKLFTACAVNPSIGRDALLLACKMSVGKALNWWKGVATGVIQPLDMKQLLLAFLCEPEETYQGMDEFVREVFTTELYRIIDKPQTQQTAPIMAKEVANTLLDGLLKNQLSDFLLNLYTDWSDSSAARASLLNYIDNYAIPATLSPLQAHPDHPFESLDRVLAELISTALEEGDDISAYLHYLSKRLESKRARFYKADWLKSLEVLLTYQHQQIYLLNQIELFCSYYQSRFAKVDSAIRHIYVAWLHKPAVLRPLQYHYEQLYKELVEKWYELANNYQSNQSGLVIDALNQAGRVAAIVGDGLRLEMAEEIATDLNVKWDNKTALATLPSVTESGMSALYGCDKVESVASTRFNQVKALVPEVEIMALDNLNDSITAEKLILTFGDIDQVGEKKQLAGLKDISNYRSLVSEKIKGLLAMGYNKVYLTTDHGFVITGILDEADKMPVPSGNGLKVEERYLLSNSAISHKHIINIATPYGGYSYQHYAKTDKPFVSRGAYGYSHGGFTPQECIIPIYCFHSESTQEGCKVTISNKSDLVSVTGNYFTVKIAAKGDASGIFSSSRKVKLQLFDNQGGSLSSILLTAKAGKTIEQEVELIGASGKVLITDKNTTEQLDSCVVKKSVARDIDDLF